MYLSMVRMDTEREMMKGIVDSEAATYAINNAIERSLIYAFVS